MLSPEQIRAIIESYIHVNNTLDTEGFVNLFAKDAAFYYVAETSPIIGEAAARQIAEQSIIPFREMHVTINRLFFVANGAAMFYTAQMTTQSGQSITSDGIDVFELNEEGKIQSIRFFLDPENFAGLVA